MVNEVVITGSGYRGLSNTLKMMAMLNDSIYQTMPIPKYKEVKRIKEIACDCGHGGTLRKVGKEIYKCRKCFIEGKYL